MFIKRVFTISCVFLLFIFVIFAISVYAETLSIKGDAVNLRTGPGKKYNVKWEYGSGFPVEVIEKNGDWLKVKDFEDDTGWLHKSVLINSPQTIVKANKNSEEKINIRQGPGSDKKIIAKAHYGVVFRILSHQSGWVEVSHESGVTGWVSSHLLWGF